MITKFYMFLASNFWENSNTTVGMTISELANNLKYQDHT